MLDRSWTERNQWKGGLPLLRVALPSCALNQDGWCFLARCKLIFHSRALNTPPPIDVSPFAQLLCELGVSSMVCALATRLLLASLSFVARRKMAQFPKTLIRSSRFCAWALILYKRAWVQTIWLFYVSFWPDVTCYWNVIATQAFMQYLSAVFIWWHKWRKEVT